MPVAPGATASVQFTEDDIGKTVVDAVGVVSAVRYGTIYVDPDPDITTRVKTTLGWEDTGDEDEYPLQDAAVSTVTNDEIRLGDQYRNN